MVRADSNGGLGASTCCTVFLSCPPAIGVITIPLWKGAARSGTKNSNFHVLHFLN